MLVSVQLLHKLSIRAGEGNHVLLKVIKNPVGDHLPIGCRKIAASFHTDHFPTAQQLVPADTPIAVVVGAMAKGKVSRFSHFNFFFAKVLTRSVKCLG